MFVTVPSLLMSTKIFLLISNQVLFHKNMEGNGHQALSLTTP